MSFKKLGNGGLEITKFPNYKISRLVLSSYETTGTVDNPPYLP